MPNLKEVVLWVLGNLFWDLLRMIPLSGILWAILRWVVGILQTWQQNLAYWLTVPIGLAIAILTLSTHAPARGTPRISGSIDKIRIAPCESPDWRDMGPVALPRDGVCVLVVAQVTNAYGGSPTITEDYKLRIREYPTIEIESRPPPEFLSVKGGEGTTLENYSAWDTLYNKTLSPIFGGSMMRGILLFQIKGVDAASLKKEGTRYLLQFVDAEPQPKSRPPYELFYDWPAKEPAYGYLPGLKLVADPPTLTPTGTATPTATPAAPPKGPGRSQSKRRR